MRTPENEVTQLLYERRVLTFVTAVTALGVVAWLAALSTDYWIIIVPEEPEAANIVFNDTTVFLWSYSGLWQKCFVFASPEVLYFLGA